MSATTYSGDGCPDARQLLAEANERIVALMKEAILLKCDINDAKDELSALRSRAEAAERRLKSVPCSMNECLIVRDERDEWRKQSRDNHVRAVAAESALRPFADALRKIGKSEIHPDCAVMPDDGLRIKHLVAAAAALSPEPACATCGGSGKVMRNSGESSAPPWEIKCPSCAKVSP